MLVRNFIFWLSTKRSVTSSIARHGMQHGFARRFVAGETLAEAITASQELCQQGRTVSLNHLGENVTTEAAAREVCAGYIEMIEQMHAKNLAGNISIKLTQLGLDLSKDLCTSFARSIAKRAAQLHRTIEMDMEGSDYTDLTLDILETVQRESGNAGLAVQAYLYRTERDLLRLAPLKPKVRLVKGAYREPRKIALQGKGAVDANFKKLTTMLLEGAAQNTFLPAIASHDPVMVAHAQAEISPAICSSKFAPRATPCRSTCPSAPTGARTSCAVSRNAPRIAGSFCAACSPNRAKRRVRTRPPEGPGD